RRVEAFVYNMLVNVLNAADTAPMVIDAILAAGSHDPGPKAQQIENPADWTPEKIVARAATLETDKGATGEFDD
ncbi:MAG: ketose-bisphosphate aldolase, partial [Desulfobacterales bacterium]